MTTSAMISVTTDGFITAEPNVSQYSCFGLAEVFEDARRALSGDPDVWEIKHSQTDLVNLTTRGNVSLQPSGVLACAGLKAPSSIPRGGPGQPTFEKRHWFLMTALSREGKVVNPHTAFPPFRELSRSEDRVDFGPRERRPAVSLDFDMKRQPIIESLRVDTVEGFEIVGFETRAWENVKDYIRARNIARHIASVRPGTTGNDRPTGCLRTREDWLTFDRRMRSGEGRRIRTADSALLTELVAAHKAGLVSAPVLASRVPVHQKLAWLSSLGLGEFTKSQWDHMSKRARRSQVLADADIEEVKSVLATAPSW